MEREGIVLPAMDTRGDQGAFYERVDRDDRHGVEQPLLGLGQKRVAHRHYRLVLGLVHLIRASGNWLGDEDSNLD